MFGVRSDLGGDDTVRPPYFGAQGRVRGKGKPFPRALGDRKKRITLSHRRPEGWWDYAVITLLFVAIQEDVLA